MVQGLLTGVLDRITMACVMAPCCNGDNCVVDAGESVIDILFGTAICKSMAFRFVFERFVKRAVACTVLCSAVDPMVSSMSIEEALINTTGLAEACLLFD